jgi:tRNA pseudouridine55 synthase
VARSGGVLDMPAATDTIDAIEMLDYRPPRVVFAAEVGPGTYLRAIARDLGERLGTGGHLTALRRERAGRFAVADAIPLERLTGREPLVPPSELVAGLDQVTLTAEEAAAARHGRRIGTAEDGARLAALTADGLLVAVAEPRDGRWQPVVVLSS